MSKILLSDKQLAALKEPLPKDAIKPHPTKNYLSSIKAIYVVERLNEVFGLGGWIIHNEVVKHEGKWVVVKSTFEAPEYGIKIPDIFGGNDNPDVGDAYKGACTDALTKIGSYLFIGMDVYKGLAERATINSGDGEKPRNNTMTGQGQKPWLNPGSKEWDNAFAKLHSGSITMDDITTNYRISKENAKNILDPKFSHNGHHADATA